MNDLHVAIGFGTGNPILSQGQIGVNAELITDALKHAVSL
jgi:hypothetical protein